MSVEESQVKVLELLKDACGGSEDAFHSLLEHPDEIEPILESAFATESSPRERAAIVEVMWQRRNPASVHALERALGDSDEVVWKEALNGLVTLASEESLKALRSAESRVAGLERTPALNLQWLKEAIDQVEASLGK